MSDQPPIGTILDPSKIHNRDAIHIAIMPAVAGEALYSGQSIFINKDGKAMASALSTVGIVDPFLTDTKGVNPGEMFYMFLRPMTIRNLRHNWDHPEIDLKAVDSYQKAMRVLYDAGHLLGRSVPDLITLLTDIAIKNESGITCHGFDSPDIDMDEVLDAFEVVTKIKIPESRLNDFYVSCSC